VLQLKNAKHTSSRMMFCTAVELTFVEMMKGTPPLNEAAVA